MSVTIRLQRVGKKDQELFRVVALDTRSKRDTKTLANLGTANFSVKPHTINVNMQDLNNWVKKGAMVSDSVRKLISS